MKKTFALLLVLLLTGLMAGQAAAQSSFGMSWSLTLPTGNTKDVTNNLSARGVNFEYRDIQSTTWGWGINAGYNVFAADKTDTYFEDNWAVSGLRSHYINTIPIYAAGYKYFGKSRRDGRFYVGLNAGTAWLEKRLTFGLYEIKESNWHLTVAPEIGYHLPWDSFLGHVSARYVMVNEAGTTESQSWLEFRLGFGLD